MSAKRSFDSAVALLALVPFAPVILILALAVRRAHGSPVLFRQIRAGLNGVEFELYKFRSMREAYDANGELLPDEVRVTPLGRFLRRSRLDELPELWLVVRGQMSLVGPRPLPLATLDRYGVTALRCRTRPGLTGLAQVSGNTLLTNQEKFTIDLLYCRNNSLMGDIGILLRTVMTIVRGERRDEQLIGKAMAQCGRS